MDTGFQLGPMETSANVSQPPYALEVASYIQTAVKSASDNRQTWESEAWQCIAYYAGQQWCMYDTSRGVLDELPSDGYEIRLTVDHFSGLIDLITAKLSGSKPGWTIMPATSSEEDQSAARASEKLLDWSYQVQRLASKVDETVKTALLTGVGILRVSYDPTKGETLADGTLSGSVEVEPVVPTDWFVDPAAASLRSARWCAERRWMHLSEIRSMWPEAGAGVAPEARVTSNSLGQSVMDSYLGQSSSTSTEHDRAEVVWYYERPSPEHPAGWMAVVVPGQGLVLEMYSELPFQRLPYAIMRTRAVPGKLYGAGYGSRLRKLQHAANSMYSLEAELIELHGNPKWFVQAGSVKASALDNSPGEVIEYTGQLPVRDTPPPLGNNQAAAAQKYIADMYSVSGISELSAGNIPASLSGRAVLKVEEMESTRLAAVSHEIEDMLSEVGSLILAHWQAYMPESMTLRVVGEDSRTEVLEFSRDSITSTDVHVTPGSMSARLSKATKQELVTIAYSNGLMGQPGSPEAVREARKALEWGDLRGVNGDDPSSEKSYAREENYLLIEAQDVPAYWFQDHEIHCAAHKELLRSQSLRDAGPEAFQAVLRHLAQHEGYKALAQAGNPAWMGHLPPEMRQMLQGSPQPAQAPQGQPAMPQPGAANGPGVGDFENLQSLLSE